MAAATPKKNPRFEVYQSFVGMQKWRWRLVARNGEIIASGEDFTTKRDAQRAVRAVKRTVAAIAMREETPA